MALPIQSFDEIVNSQASAMKANSATPLDFSQGSVLLALIQANAANSIWLQALATTLLSVTRLSTSSGLDVDTFIEDFGYSRAAGNPSSGNVIFSRFTTTVEGTVPVGTLVSVSSTNLNFAVYADLANPNYDSGLNAYILDIGDSFMEVPVVCTLSGTLGNVLAGAINTINNSAQTPGIDQVANLNAFTNGENPATDTEAKQGFLLYINSLSRATLQAIEYAVSISKTPSEYVKRYNIVENENEGGSPQLGYFYVVVDNGTGSPCSDDLIDAVSANVELYRGLTIQYNVNKATFIGITITVDITLVPQPTEDNATIQANIQSALQAYAATIPFNEPFLYSKISQIVYEADVNVASVLSGLSAPILNGSNVDVAGDNLSVFSPPSVTVNIV